LDFEFQYEELFVHLEFLCISELSNYVYKMGTSSRTEEKTMMKLRYAAARLVRQLASLAGMLTFLLFLGLQPLPVSAESSSYVRIIDASPDVATVDIFVDGVKLVGNNAFATVTDYLQLPPGRHKVQAALIGKGIGAASINQTLSLSTGVAYTVAALGTKATGFSLKLFVDNNVMASGMAKVRIYHLSPGTGPISVAVDKMTAVKTAVKNLSYPQASDYFRLPAGLYTFLISASRPSLILLDTTTLRTNRVTSIFIVGVGKGTPPLQFVNAQVIGLPGMSRTGSDPDVLASNQQSFTPPSPWPLGILALGGMFAGMLTRFWPFAYRKKLNRFQQLLWSLFVLVLALAISVDGFLLASSASIPTPPPVGHLLIPAINVAAPIESVGVLRNSDLETPAQSPWNDVGWYSGGPHPGEKGSAVIDGHLDRPGGNPAVFWDLHKLHIGDKVIVVDPHGRTLQFHVIRMMFYSPQDAPIQDIFGNKAGRFLNLTTCAGDWIPTQHQTALRLVVYTALGSFPNVPTPGATSTPSTAPTSRPASTSSTAPTPRANSTSSTAPTSQATSSSSTAPPPQATSTPSTVQPSPTAAPPSLIPFQLTGIDLSVSPSSIAGLLCNISVTLTYTATFHAVANSGGGTVQFTYTWNSGHASSSASLTFAPGETSKSFTFVQTILLSPLSLIGSAQVLANSPNAVDSPQVHPTGLCG
jgi:sortase (surface protein transpeptidase)